MCQSQPISNQSRVRLALVVLIMIAASPLAKTTSKLCKDKVLLLTGPGDFPDISVGKESACNAGDPSSIPGSGRAPEGKATLPTPVFWGFPCGSVGKEFAHNVGGLGSIPGLGRSPREGKGYPFQ